MLNIYNIDTTLFLIRLIGFFFLITGLSFILRKEMMIGIIDELFSNRIFSYFLGCILLLCGLVLILIHPEWDDRLDIVSSLIGWYLVLESIMYIFLSKDSMLGLLRIIKNRKYYFLITIPYTILGIFLLVISSF